MCQLLITLIQSDKLLKPGCMTWRISPLSFYVQNDISGTWSKTI